jgi:hypothetical protein
MYTQHKPARFVFAVAAIAALAAGGTAFTSSNTFASGATKPLTGYGSTNVSGATVNSMAYTLNGAGDNVNSVTLVLAGDTTGSAVSIGFNAGTTTSCGTGAFTTGTPGSTSYTCDNGGSNFVRSTAGLTSTAVVVN